MSQQVTLKASRISKSFPGVKALQDVEIELHAGSIHALLGENGAGKSTLIKILTGVYQPDEGSVQLLGQTVRFSDTNEARQQGIAVVHQERHLIPRFSVGENLFLDRLGDQAWSWVDYPKLHEEAKPWLAAVGLDLDPETPVKQLSVAKMQLVEIAQAISQKSRVLLMDEPTASLTPHETEKLFSLLQKLKDDGVTIVFVSHKLEEVLQICDYLTVLRDGQNTCTSQPIAQYDRQDLVQLMIGRKEQIPAWQTREVNRQSPKLELRQVSTEVGHKDLDLQLYPGEILGFYGLIGAGRSELAKSLIGYFRMTKGEYLLDGKAVHVSGVSVARDRYAIGYLSEDRKSEGLILQHDVLQNSGITVWRKICSKLGWLSDQQVTNRVSPSIDKLEVKTPSLAQMVGNLSGGNQQKISVAKWLAAQVEILIVDEPSVGIDIKTKAYLHELIRELADQGTSILLITSDMPEIITLADRIIVMDDFVIKGDLPNNRNYEEMSTGIMNLIHSCYQVKILRRALFGIKNLLGISNLPWLHFENLFLIQNFEPSIVFPKRIICHPELSCFLLDNC